MTGEISSITLPRSDTFGKKIVNSCYRETTFTYYTMIVTTWKIFEYGLRRKEHFTQTQ